MRKPDEYSHDKETSKTMRGSRAKVERHEEFRKTLSTRTFHGYEREEVGSRCLIILKIFTAHRTTANAKCGSRKSTLDISMLLLELINAGIWNICTIKKSGKSVKFNYCVWSFGNVKEISTINNLHRRVPWSRPLAQHRSRSRHRQGWPLSRNRCTCLQQCDPTPVQKNKNMDTNTPSQQQFATTARYLW